jgi:hypothetical protein
MDQLIRQMSIHSLDELPQDQNNVVLNVDLISDWAMDVASQDP